MSNQYLSFDVTKQSTPQQLITGRQGDSQLKFVTMLLWDGDKNIPYDLTGKQVVFEALKPDNTHIVDYEGITILDAPAGLVRYSFNEQVFSVAGTMQQAFFKITHTDSDNNVIADSTLEVAINILENRVEFGINSEDYLSEYDDLIVKVEKKFDDYATTVQDSIDKAQKIHEEITTYTNLIQSSQVLVFNSTGNAVNGKAVVETLTAKADGSKQQVYPETDAEAVLNLGNFVKDNVQQFGYQDAVAGGFVANKNRWLESVSQSAESFSRSRPRYRMVSIGYGTIFPIDADDVKRIGQQGADISLCTLVYVNDKNDSNPISPDYQYLRDGIDKCEQSGAHVSMLKPHINLYNQLDSFNRTTYNPSDYTAFFNNWKALLLEYAKVCVEKNIDILCIGCEMFNTIDKKYIDNWTDIAQSIHAIAPDLIITYAMSVWEYTLPLNQGTIASVVDYIGFNTYPSWTTRSWSEGLTYLDLLPGWYSDNGKTDFQSAIDYLCDKYSKPALLTEVGFMPQPDAVNKLLSDTKDADPNFDVLAEIMKAVFTIIRQTPNIYGLVWWGNSTKPFTYFKKDSVVITEKILTDYYKEGKIDV